MQVAVSAAALTLLAAVMTAPIANADTPPPLGSGHVTDISDVLSDAEEAALEDRLDDLASAADLPELFVVIVPAFENPGNALAWADDTALRNNLASDQYLLAIATEGRSLAISAEYGGEGVAAGPLDEARILEIEDRLGSDYLSHEDWAGGVEFVADEFSKTPWPWWVWALGLAGFALIIFAVTRLVAFLRRRAALAAELRTLDGQKRRAARLLVRGDEAVRTSEQELGFVIAEFGEETAAEFTAVLTESRARLQEGFALLEKLQDAEEDAPAQTRAWTDSIISLCAQIDTALDGRRSEIASLRALADGAAENLARLRSARTDAAALQRDTAQRLESLAGTHPPADLIGVADNAAEIDERLREADVQLEALQKAVGGRQPRAITRAVHEIERLLAEAKDLHDAVEATAVALAAGSASPTAPASSTASLVDQAAAAVRAAEMSVQARAGQVGSFPLRRLNAARRELERAASALPENAEVHAQAALVAAQDVQNLISAPVAPVSGRFVRTASTTPADDAVMYDPPSHRGSAVRRETPSSADGWDDEPGTAGKAMTGAVGGGAVGFVGSLGISDGEPGVIVAFVIGGVLLGALAGAFGGGGSGGGGGGTSSGWGGSSRSSRSSRSSSWGGSRSSGSRSSRSSGRSSGGSRSSGRSGGRRF